MNDLQIFKNAEFGSIRVIEKDGEPWLVGKDVSDALGYDQTSNMVKRLDSEDFMSSKLDGMNMKSIMINESGFYAAVLGSHLPTAKKFKRWVTSEVLPAIRKHGTYMTPEKIEEVLLNPDVIINLATQLKQERELNEKLDFTVRSQEKQIEELKPLAAYVKTILNNKSLVTVEQIAQDYGMSAQKLNKTLHELHIQYKGGNGQWILYQEHKQFGYVHSETISFKRSDGRPDTTMHTKWTQKGRMFLYEKLKESGMLPLIERDIEGKAI